ncbi:hypothetical protein F3P66_03295 [Agrobacterium fabrum]|uniref:Uncharacterized protein n=1 Tax=Agrobacterium fabrum (strain C58 / ATCC 33970) TaxID=176299 RepID=Q8UDD5_AGRFC|nr:hypothetical protein Atu2192 [Agrobacterium fabrum str. C58]QRM58564.1 hypothetical protein F3P66_03295 [Agrobacterium fabrum]TRB29334.1 hypothetical protein EXN51_12465 [Agrobacterium fabrum]
MTGGLRISGEAALQSFDVVAFKSLSIHSGPEVRGALPPSALPGISPSRGEIDLRQGFALLDA